MDQTLDASEYEIKPASEDASFRRYFRIFAGGDVVTGAATVIEAIARGRKAAKYVHAKLAGIVAPREIEKGEAA